MLLRPVLLKLFIKTPSVWAGLTGEFFTFERAILHQNCTLLAFFTFVRLT